VHRCKRQRPAKPARYSVAKPPLTGRSKDSCSILPVRSTVTQPPRISRLQKPNAQRFVHRAPPCYDVSKRFGETLCVTFARQEGVPVKIARPVQQLWTGPEITDGRVISDFARDIIQAATWRCCRTAARSEPFVTTTDAIGRLLTKCWYAVDPVAVYIIGIDRPEVSMADCRICRQSRPRPVRIPR